MAAEWVVQMAAPTAALLAASMAVVSVETRAVYWVASWAAMKVDKTADRSAAL